MAFSERLGLTQYHGVHKLCDKKKVPVIWNQTLQEEGGKS